jgi:hypothetical protein
MHNILINWDELRAYFSCCTPSGSQAVRYKARELESMLEDEGNRAYFHFAVPVLTDFERINAFFQADNADPEKVVDELQKFHRSLKNRLFTIEGNEKAMTHVDFGGKFLQHVQKLKFDEASIIKTRCQEMLRELLTQLEKRIPNDNIFSKLSLLKPDAVLSHVRRAPFEKLPMQQLLEKNYNKIEDQYRRIICENWTDILGRIPDDTATFWCEVLQKQEEYVDLAMYALTCLSTPLSNASVERLFSVVTAVKNKARNRLKLETLLAILRLRTYVRRDERWMLQVTGRYGTHAVVI